MKTNVSRLIKIPVFLLVLLALVSCKSLTISMDNKVPPTFTFSAGRFAECCRHLAFLGVYEILPENQDVPWLESRPKEDMVLWQIWPQEGTDNSADSLPSITYGKTPPGFIQKIPAQGEPPPLREGKVYEVGGPPIEVPNRVVCDWRCDSL